MYTTHILWLVQRSVFYYGALFIFNVRSLYYLIEKMKMRKIMRLILMNWIGIRIVMHIVRMNRHKIFTFFLIITRKCHKLYDLLIVFIHSSSIKNNDIFKSPASKHVLNLFTHLFLGVHLFFFYWLSNSVIKRYSFLDIYDSVYSALPCSFSSFFCYQYNYLSQTRLI